MNTRRIITNKTALYLIGFLVIIVTFLLLGGGVWIRTEMVHGSGSIYMGNWNWVQILTSLGLGFLLGYMVFRRKW